MRKRKTARPTLRRNITKTEEYIFGLCVIRVIQVTYDHQNVRSLSSGIAAVAP